MTIIIIMTTVIRKTMTAKSPSRWWRARAREPHGGVPSRPAPREEPCVTCCCGLVGLTVCAPALSPAPRPADCGKTGYT